MHKCGGVERKGSEEKECERKGGGQGKGDSVWEGERVREGREGN